MTAQNITMQDIYSKIKLVQDFPKPGINFRHIGPLLAEPLLFKKSIELLNDLVTEDFDYIAGLDARGFIMATAFQYLTNKPQIMIRKASKIPGPCYTVSYNKEYGQSTLELEKDTLKPGSRVLIVDDLIATAGTLLAAADLVQQAGCTVSGFACLIELGNLGGRKKIEESVLFKTQPNGKKTQVPEVHSLFVYDYDWSEFNKLTGEKEAAGHEEIEEVNCIPVVNRTIGSEVVLNKEAKETANRVEPFLYRPLSSCEDDANDMRPIIMAHPTLYSKAQKIVKISNYRWSQVVWDYFPDGWPNITFEDSKYLANRDLTFLMSMSRKELFLEQMALLIAMPRQLIKSLTIFIDYLGPGTHERVDYSGMLATVEPVLKLISSAIPMTSSGPPIIRIFDIHALPTRFYTKDDVTMKLCSAVPILKRELEKDNKPNISEIKEMGLKGLMALKDLKSMKEDSNRIVIAFPDDGAYKRFKYYFSDYTQIICSKTRIGDERHIVIKDRFNWPEDPELQANCYNKVLIVDDLVQSGSTIIECAKALRNIGFKSVDAYVTHAIFPNDSWRRFDNIIDTFYVTNTNPEVTCKLVNKPFKVLGIEEEIVSIMSKQYQKDLNRNKKDLEIYVASECIDKLEAVRRMFGTIDKNVTIYGLKGIKSGVNEQPFGIDETLKGAMNRIDMAIDSIGHSNKTNRIFISIENGIVENLEMIEGVKEAGAAEGAEGAESTEAVNTKISEIVELGLESKEDTKTGSKASTFHDVPIVVVSYTDDKFVHKRPFINLDSSVDVTKYWHYYADKKGQADTWFETFGSVIEKQFGFRKGHWHKQLFGVSRIELINKTIEKMLHALRDEGVGYWWTLY